MLMSPNKDETAVHGCHCQGDMAVRMRKVLQTAGLVFECVTCFFRVSLAFFVSHFTLAYMKGRSDGSDVNTLPKFLAWMATWMHYQNLLPMVLRAHGFAMSSSNIIVKWSP